LRHLGGDRRQLIFFSPDISDTSTIKRAQEFIDQGYALTVFGFRRDRYNRDYAPTWPHVCLGYTEDRKYGRRASAVLAASAVLWAQRHRLRRASVLYARNIDQLILAVLARALFCPRAFLAYEMLDIPPIQVGRGVASTVLRAIERFCLCRVGALVLSSPGFLENYFAPLQGYRGEWFLLENKVHPSVSAHSRDTAAEPMARQRRRAPYRWVVGYFGLIRGAQTFELMTRLAARLGDLVQFKFRGVLTTVDRRRFEAALAKHPNMVYEGDYLNPADLDHIYSEVDFAWALDLEHVDHNSRWLLPCRYYEAGLYGVPCLAIRNFEIGKLIDKLDVGWTFAEPLEDGLAKLFETLTEAEYVATQNRLLSLPRRNFVASDDIAALCRVFDASVNGLVASGENQHDGSNDPVPIDTKAAHVEEEKGNLVSDEERQPVEDARIGLLPSDDRSDERGISNHSPDGEHDEDADRGPRDDIARIVVTEIDARKADDRQRPDSRYDAKQA
jgi:succinoglycan biosynthesis protein ExoL